jgi:hypothetical protein
LAFIHAHPEELPLKYAEADAEGRRRLEVFRSRVMADYPVKKWSNAQELGGHVSRGLTREIRLNPRPGWMRNSESSNIFQLLEQISILQKENGELRKRMGALEPIENIEGGSDIITMSGSATDRFRDHSIPWKIEISWDGIFKILGPGLMNEASENQMAVALAETGYARSGKKVRPNYAISTSEPSIQDVVIQLRAQGLIEKSLQPRPGTVSGVNYWTLTEFGDRQLMRLLARKKP